LTSLNSFQEIVFIGMDRPAIEALLDA